ncbi:MAG: molybdopterin-binding protein [Thermoleophilaceae bacterium]
MAPVRLPGPLGLLAGGAVAVVLFLLVLGLVAGDPGPDAPSAPPTGTDAADRPRGERGRRRPRRRPAPTSVSLRVTPSEATYVCVEDGAGKVRFEGVMAAPRRFRAKRLRINLGKRSVAAGRERTPHPLRRRARHSGRLRPASATRAPAARRSGALLVSVRAGIVVTGTEVLSGRVRDRNGPWLADRLLELGVELAHVTICGDRPEDMEAQLRFMADEGVELMITSGGLGPTADDLTAEVVGRFQGRPLRLDEDLEQRIADIVAPLARRWRNVDPEAMRLGTRKQAMVPEGAAVLEPAGTAPGLVVAPANGSAPTVVVLPGPPRELHEMWPAAVRSEPFTAAIGNRTLYEQRMLRMFGIPESEIAETLRVAESEVADMERLEITTCLRRGEVEMVTRYEPGVGERGVAWSRGRGPAPPLRHAVLHRRVERGRPGGGAARRPAPGGGRVVHRRPHGRAPDRAAGVVGVRGRRGRLLRGRGQDRAGGGRPCADRAPRRGVGRGGRGDGRWGARAARGRRGDRDHGRGRAGGGSEEKPVGTVCWSVRSAAGAALTRQVRLPGDRGDVRDRSTTVGMHLLRRLLRGEDAPLWRPS